jgi:hypothetical protein
VQWTYADTPDIDILPTRSEFVPALYDGRFEAILVQPPGDGRSSDTASRDEDPFRCASGSQHVVYVFVVRRESRINCMEEVG